MITGSVSAATITVDDNKAADYSSIQAAVNSAIDGDTILVSPGTYIENVDINVTNITIISGSGPDSTTVKAKISDDHVFYISENGVTINGFKVTGATGYRAGGIYLDQVSENNITDCIVENNYYGIYLNCSGGNTLTGNTASNNVGTGISLEYYSDNNNLNDNTASNNAGTGFFLYGSYNILNDNIATNNAFNGITLSGLYNTLAGSTATNNAYYGISLHGSYNTLTGNTASNNAGTGISLFLSRKNNLTNNTVSNNTYIGISLAGISNTLHGNLMQNNTYNFQECNFFPVNIVDTSNLVNGKPIYYLKNVSDIEINSSSNAGTVYLINCKNVSVKDLQLEKNGYGIYLHNTTDSILENNTVTSNNVIGIFLSDSSGNTLIGNVASNNGDGIRLYGSSGNTLTGNTATSNNHEGISLGYSSGSNNLTGNTASKNAGTGVSLSGSSNTLTGNIASYNAVSGISLYSSSNNTIYNNYFNNMNNVIFSSINPDNIWNSTKTSGTNIVDGPYLGGNFWAQPDGNGWSQTNPDVDGDGICDSPYYADGYNVDYLPLVLLDYSGNTLSGTDVQVNPYPGVSVEFSEVTVSGDTTVSTSTSNPGSEKTGFKFLKTYYEISTTAEYNPPLTICFSYNDSEIPGNSESSLKVFQWNGTDWEDVTSWVDTENNILCTVVDSFLYREV